MSDSDDFMELFDKDFSNNKALLGSSQNQNIVITLGITGSGKSTLLNFLLENELFYDQLDQDIKLKYQENANSFPIGHSACSKTTFPKFLYLNNVLFYDFPGMNDTPASYANICNASLIKNITEGANSVKLLFVIAQDQITAGRANALSKIFDSFNKGFSCKQKIEDCSLLIVTKTGVHTTQGLNEFLNSKVKKEDLAHINRWIQQNRIFPMSTSLLDCERSEILCQLSDLNSLVEIQVNAIALLSENAIEQLKQLYKNECDRIIEKTIKDFYDSKALNTEVDDEVDFFENEFKSQAKKEFFYSELIRILNVFDDKARTKNTYKFKSKVERKKFLWLLKFKLLQYRQIFDRKSEANALKLNTLENELKSQNKLYLDSLQQYHEEEMQLKQNKLTIENYKTEISEQQSKFNAFNDNFTTITNKIQTICFIPEVDVIYRIKSAQNGDVLNCWAYDLDNNSVTYALDHDFAHNHRHWRFTKTSEIGIYIIQNIFSGNYLSVADFSPSCPVPVMMKGLDFHDRCKKWKIIYFETGYKINSLFYPHLYLESSGKRGKGSGKLGKDSMSLATLWLMVIVEKNK